MSRSQLGWYTLQVAIIGGVVWVYLTQVNNSPAGVDAPVPLYGAVLIGVGLALFLTVTTALSIDWFKRAAPRDLARWAAIEVAIISPFTLGALVGDVANVVAWTVMGLVVAVLVFLFIAAGGLFGHSPTEP